MGVRRSALALVVVVVSSITTMAVGTGVASAAPFTASGTLNCVAHAPIIGDQSASQTLTINSDAPTSVLPGATFTVTSQTPPDVVATNQSGGTVSSIQSLAYKVPVPANSTFVSASFSGGFNYGTGTPTATLSGSATTGTVIFAIPGPIPAGQSYQLPALTLNLKATGPDFSTIQVKLGGTSLSDTGFTTTANITSPISASVATDCWPQAPSPVWTTTTIAPPDVTPPTITFSTPADGGQYPLGGTVAANFSCNDGQFGSGVATCTGTVANGSPIDTAALGLHTFTVNSTDVKGNASAPVTHTYTVVPPGNDHTPPVITFPTPAHGAVYQLGQVVNAAFSCSDPSGISACAGTVANGAAINTATAGPKSFTVNATDGEGNTASVLHSYSVMPGPVQQNWTTGDVTNRMPVGCDTLFNAFHESIPTISNTAPQLAGAGSQFTWTMAIDNDVVPTLNNGTGLIYRWKKPTNGHFVSAAFTGPGINVNGAAIAINADGTLQITIASVTDTSILGFGDDPFRPPPFQAVVQADGAAGTIVKNFFDYFQITTTTVGSLVTTQHCPAGDTFNNRVNVALTNTLVVDSTPPTVNVTSPVNGASYAPGAVLKFNYSCTDAGSTPSCTGDFPNGTTLNTSTSGTFTLHANSADPTGNTAAQTVSYTIADPTVSVGNASVTQGPGAVLSFPITLSNPSNSSVSVTYATADGTATQPADYSTASGSVTFNPGDPLTKVVTVPVNTAQYFGGARTMTLNLVSAVKATLGTASATGSIVSATPPAVSVSDAASSELGGNLDFAVSLASQPIYPLSVAVQTADGTAVAAVKYVATSDTLTFNPGDPLTQHVLVPVLNTDVYDEGASTVNTQTMTLTATETVNGFSASGTGTITDDETQPMLISIGNATVREGDDTHPRTVKLSVTLNHPATTTISAHYTTATGGADGNASINTDYKTKSGTVVFRPKTEMAYVSIPVLGDTVNEGGNETFSVKLSGAANGFIVHGTGTITLLEDDSPTSSAVEASVTDQTVYEGGAAKTTKVAFLVSLSRRPSAAVTLGYTVVDGSASAPSDYKVKTGTLTFTPTQIGKTVVIVVIGDDVLEGDQTFNLVITPVSGSVSIPNNTGVATILNDD